MVDRGLDELGAELRSLISPIGGARGQLGCGSHPSRRSNKQFSPIVRMDRRHPRYRTSRRLSRPFARTRTVRGVPSGGRPRLVVARPGFRDCRRRQWGGTMLRKGRGTMTITLELPPEAEAELWAEVRRRDAEGVQRLLAQALAPTVANRDVASEPPISGRSVADQLAAAGRLVSSWPKLRLTRWRAPGCGRCLGCLVPCLVPHCLRRGGDVNCWQSTALASVSWR